MPELCHQCQGTGYIILNHDSTIACSRCDHSGIAPPKTFQNKPIQRTGERELEVTLYVRIPTWGIPGRRDTEVAYAVARILHNGLHKTPTIMLIHPDTGEERQIFFDPVVNDGNEPPGYTLRTESPLIPPTEPSTEELTFDQIPNLTKQTTQAITTTPALTSRQRAANALNQEILRVRLEPQTPDPRCVCHISAPPGGVLPMCHLHDPPPELHDV